MSVARRRARAKKEATRRADMLPTYPCEGSTLPRDRLRSERPPAAVLECGEQSRAGRFMLEARARSVLMIEPSILLQLGWQALYVLLCKLSEYPQ